MIQTAAKTTQPSANHSQGVGGWTSKGNVARNLSTKDPLINPSQGCGLSEHFTCTLCKTSSKDFGSTPGQ